MGTSQRRPARMTGRGQRYDAPLDRGHRPIRRGNDGAAAVGHRDTAGQGVFLDRHLKQARHIVERDDFATVLQSCGDGRAALARDERQWRGRRRVLTT